MKAIPTLKESPLFGSTAALKNDRLNLFLRIAQECGDIGACHFYGIRTILFNSPQLCQHVLVEHAHVFEPSSLRKFAFRSLVGNGMMNREGQAHLKQRQLLAPAFQHRRITSYTESITAYSERTQQEWAEGTSLDMVREMTRLTLSIIGKVLFAADIFTEANELGSAIATATKYVDYSATRPFLSLLNLPTARNNQSKKAVKLLDQRILPLIAERRASGEDRGDFLSMLLLSEDKSGLRLTDKEIRDEAVMLFVAGHETMAFALSWCFYLLGKHPDVYSKLQLELDSVLQGKTPTYADLAHLPFTTQVFKESLRLYPPIPILDRMPEHTVEIMGYRIYPWEVVMISPYILHRRSDYFPDPERFNPERFTPENEKKLPRYVFIPFGAGSRICLGNHFALQEGYLVLATIAQRVTFELLPGQEVRPAQTFNLRPDPGIQVVVRHRPG